ncbi:hypothetical protein EDB19DRAFT_1894853 [Suillus lakei]|nr:hypothetical protein EDB19DRAFT_1894853 [Suillus lakei]
MLADWPAGEDWDDVNAAAVNAMVEVQWCYAFSPAGLTHRCGRYHALSTSISYGGGQWMPANLAHGRLLGNSAIKRLAGFGSSALAFYAPKLYRHFSHNVKALVERHPHLCMNFTNSIFLATTFNFRPQVATFEHTDPHNVAYGLCDIHALGSFDPKAGGHLILFDLKVVVELPSGSTAHILETQFSFTQYFAGSLIRWELRVQDPCLMQKLDREVGKRWEWGLSFFSKLTEVEGDRGQLFKRKAPDHELPCT